MTCRYVMDPPQYPIGLDLNWDTRRSPEVENLSEEQYLITRANMSPFYGDPGSETEKSSEPTTTTCRSGSPPSAPSLIAVHPAFIWHTSLHWKLNLNELIITTSASADHNSPIIDTARHRRRRRLRLSDYKSVWVWPERFHTHMLIFCTEPCERGPELLCVLHAAKKFQSFSRLLFGSGPQI